MKADLEDKIIAISVIGNKENRRALLSVIRTTLQTINCSFAKLQVTEFIPYENILISYQDLLKLEGMGEIEYLVPSLQKKLNIKTLLNGIDIRESQVSKILAIEKEKLEQESEIEHDIENYVYTGLIIFVVFSVIVLGIILGTQVGLKAVEIFSYFIAIVTTLGYGLLVILKIVAKQKAFSKKQKQLPKHDSSHFEQV